MIIVKTKNGDRFINDRAVTMVEHDIASEAIETVCQHLTCGNHSIVEISPTLRGYARSIISRQRKLLNIEH